MPALTQADLNGQLAELTTLPGIAGEEGAVASWLTERLRGAGLAPMLDGLGNVVLARPGPRPRLLVSAHMDQVGFMVSRIEQGQARCLPVGDPQLAPDRAEAVLIPRSDAIDLTGMLQATGNGEALLRTSFSAQLRVGDSVVFARRLSSEEGTLVSAPALDNRIGCLVALQAALAGSAADDVAFAWTVREETEQSGIIRVARDLEPAAVVAVDITAASHEAESFDSLVTCGSGPAITLLDEGLSVHRPLLNLFTAAAEALGVSWQPEVARAGLSEAGQVQQLLGIPSLALLVPIENVHSSRERADLADITGAIALLEAVTAR